MATSLVLSPTQTSHDVNTTSADIIDGIHALTLTSAISKSTTSSTQTSTSTSTSTSASDSNDTTSTAETATSATPSTSTSTSTSTSNPTSTTSPSPSPSTSTPTPIKAEDLQNNPETGLYDEVEIEDMEWDGEKEIYTYPCPCGDKFIISKLDLLDGEEIARCPSCSLLIRVIYDLEEFQEQHAS